MSRLPDNAAGKRKGISYAKWGYLFIAPFFIIYAVFNLYPLALTIYNSFFENYRSGLKQVGPNFVGLANYVKLFTPDDTGTIDILKYAGNTVVLWVGGAIPQILIALLLAIFFTSYRLNIRGQQFFKTVIYMPNLIMASAFSMLFYTLFSNVGPVNQLLMQSGMASQPIDFFTMKITVRTLICLMNFLLWFGNTTILLMAGIMGIDQNMFEAANIDGANSVPHPGLHRHHSPHRRPADVRRASGSDQRRGQPQPQLHDPDYVPEQLSEDQQELRHVRRHLRDYLPHYRTSQPAGVQVSDQKGLRREFHECKCL